MTTVRAPGDTIELRAERLDKAGRVTGTSEGTLVYATGMLVGELAQVELEHVGKRGRAYGKAVSILEPSPGRRAAPCRHHGVCGGCPFMDADESFMAACKSRALAELGIDVDRVVMDDRKLGYRWSSKRVIRDGCVGSYRPGTHELASMRGCLVDHPDIAACFDELEASGGCKGLRYAWAKTNGKGEVLLTLVLDGDREGVEAFARTLKRPTGIACCIQDAEGNAMRGRDPRHLCGASTIEVELCGVAVSLGPLGFLQPNPPIAELAYADLIGAERGTLAFDLYAGAGVTTHLLRSRFDDVRACEAFPESAAALGVEALSAEAFLEAEREVPQLIVANPPRAGLGSTVCEAIVALALSSNEPFRLHVMSCEPRALARDIERLTEASTFELVGARAYDTLPQTAHIEVVAWLQRRI